MSVTSRALEPSFAARVRETSLVVCGLGLLTLLAGGQAWSRTLSFASGTAVAVLIWLSAEQVGLALGSERLGWRRGLALAAVYFGKYAVAALVLWLLAHSGALDPLGFAVGFSVPGLVVLLKALGLQSLAPEVAAAPYYSKFARERWPQR